MSLSKVKIRQLNNAADNIAELRRQLNMKCVEFDGVAAVIPAKAPYPASRFAGKKVILHNVSFNYAAGDICANISMPYYKNDKSGGSSFSNVYKFAIDEDWFE